MHLLKAHGLAPLLAAVSVLGCDTSFAEMTVARDGKHKKGDLAAGARVECLVARAPSGLTGVPEASDLAVSRRTPGILWTHGDSFAEEPYLYAFDPRGASKGKVRLEGVNVADWEATAVGPCGSSTCQLSSWSPATSSACGRASACRWMVHWLTARARWTKA